MASLTISLLLHAFLVTTSWARNGPSYRDPYDKGAYQGPAYRRPHLPTSHSDRQPNMVVIVADDLVSGIAPCTAVLN